MKSGFLTAVSIFFLDKSIELRQIYLFIDDLIEYPLAVYSQHG